MFPVFKWSVFRFPLFLKQECHDKLVWLLGRLVKLLVDDGRQPQVKLSFLFSHYYFFLYWFDSLSIEYYDSVKERLPLMVTIQPWVFITKC